MPKRRTPARTATTQTKVATKTKVKTSTLVALAWAVAFAAMGLAASNSTSATTTRHLITRFVETSKGIVSTYIHSQNTRTPVVRRLVAPHEIGRGVTLNFAASSTMSAVGTDAVFAFAAYNFTEAQVKPTGVMGPQTDRPSTNSLYRGIQKTWGANSQFNWTTPLNSGNLNPEGVTATDNLSNYYDVIVYTGIKLKDKSGRLTGGVRLDDYAIIRFKVVDTVAPSTSITVFKNNAFADRTATNPTGVAGAQDVKIASFIIQGDPREPAIITYITLKDPSPDNALGNNFQNLRLKHNNSQLGITIATLTGGIYRFEPPGLVLGADESYVMDIFADIKSDATKTNTLLNPVITIDEVLGVGYDSHKDNSVRTDVLLQTGYVAVAGSLRVNLSPETPTSQQLIMGQTNVPFAKFQFTAGPEEPVEIRSITLNNNMFSAPAQQAVNQIKNLRLFDQNNTQQGTTATAMRLFQSTSTAYVTFDILGLKIPAGQTETLTLVADLAPFSDSETSGAAHLFYLAATDYNPDTTGQQSAIQAYGVNSSQEIVERYGTNPEWFYIDQFAKQMLVYRTTLTLDWNSNTPDGSSTGSTEQIVGIVTAYNATNEGRYDATLETFGVKLDFNEVIGFSPGRKIKIYKDSIDQANLVAEKSISLDNGTRYVLWDIVSTDGSFADTPIAAGQNRTFFITLDTSGARPNGRLSISVTHIRWGDGVVNHIYSAERLPLPPKTLTY